MKTDSLVIETSIDNTKLKKGLAEANDKVKDTSTNMVKGMQTALNAFGSYLATSFIKNSVTSFISAGVSVNNLSKTISASAEDVQSWQKLIEKAGGSAQDFANTAVTMQKGLNLFNTIGNPELAAKFQYFRLNLDKSTTSLSAFMQMADKLHDMKDVRQQYAMGEAFNVSPEMVRMLAQGGDALSRNLDLQKQLGVASQADIDKAMKANALMVEFNQKLMMLKNTIANEVIPIIDDWAHRLNNAFTVLKTELGLTNKDVAKFIIAFAGVTTIVTAIGAIGIAFTGLGVILSPINITLAAIVASFMAIVKLKEKLGDWGIRNKIREALGLSPDTSIIPNLGVRDEIRDKLGMSNDTTQNMTPVSPPAQAPMMSQFNSQGRVNPLQAMSDALFKKLHATLENAANVAIGYKFKKTNGVFDTDAQGRKIYERDAQGNKIPETYGQYQITPAKASEVMGRKVTPNELLNPAFNEQVRDKIMNKLLIKHNGDRAAALSEYNGYGKLHQKTGHSPYSDKAEGMAAGFINGLGKVVNALSTPAGTMSRESPAVQQSVSRQPNPTMSEASNPNNKNVSNTINVAALHLPDVKDAHGFVKGLSDLSATAWSFSNSNIA